METFAVFCLKKSDLTCLKLKFAKIPKSAIESQRSQYELRHFSSGLNQDLLELNLRTLGETSEITKSKNILVLTHSVRIIPQKHISDEKIFNFFMQMQLTLIKETRLYVTLYLDISLYIL